jgi:paraquat-inducible protein A
MGSVIKLFESGDVTVALVVMLFSVIVPTLKVLSLFFISIFMESKFAHGIVKFFKLIGKWSMLDVFIVALFLVYLTANKGDISRAKVEVGLYFFLAYVIVSMLMSLSADKMLHRLKG